MSLEQFGFDSSLQPSSTFGLGVGPDLSVIQNDPENFQLSLDVHNFEPHELSIKHVNDSIVIHGKLAVILSCTCNFNCIQHITNHLFLIGKHEERNDPHGFLSREFTRRFTLPQSLDARKVCCHLGNNQLTILGPEAAKRAERCGNNCLSIEHESSLFG